MPFENEEINTHLPSASLEEKRREARKHCKKVERRLYIFSLVVWFVDLLTVLFAPIFGAEKISMTVFFLTFAVLILQGVQTGTFEGLSKDTELVPRRFFDRFLSAVGTLSLLVAIIGMGITMVNGGGPKIVDGTYYIVSHGDLVKEITEWQYRVFSYTEQLFMSSGMLYFSTFMFGNVRYLYRLHYAD